MDSESVHGGSGGRIEYESFLGCAAGAPQARKRRGTRYAYQKAAVTQNRVGPPVNAARPRKYSDCYEMRSNKYNSDRSLEALFPIDHHAYRCSFLLSQIGA